MFVINKHVQTSNTTERDKRMATKEAVKEVGIIGQMYEDRKTKKRGVLESREPKYKTLMLRDTDGKSFNITYSTFKSNWRKYQGEEVAETSTQVEEKEVEKQAETKKVEKAISEKSDTVRFSTEEKVKAVRALEKFIDERLSANKSELKVSRNSRGGVIVGHSRFTAFEVWVKYGIDMYDIFFRDVIADSMDESEFKALAETSKTTYKEHETWPLRHGYRVPNTELGNFLDKLIVASDAYCKAKAEQKNTKKKDEKEKE